MFKSKRYIKNLFILIFVSMVFSIQAQEKILMDTKVITLENGNPNCILWPGGETNFIYKTNADFNWVTPYNYKDGIVYLYIKVLENNHTKYPCIWPIWGTRKPEHVHRWWDFDEGNDFNKNGASFMLKGPGVYGKILGRPSELTGNDAKEWKGHTISLDSVWTTGLGNDMWIDIQFRGPHSECKEPCGGAQISWKDTSVFPIKVRMAQVVVAKGYKFSGWDNILGDSLAVRPVIEKQPVSISANEGEKVEFSVKVSGTGPFMYQWYKNNKKVITMGKTPTLKLTVSKNDINSIFYCTISNNFGISVTDTVGIRTLSVK